MIRIFDALALPNTLGDALGGAVIPPKYWKRWNLRGVCRESTGSRWGQQRQGRAGIDYSSPPT